MRPPRAGRFSGRSRPQAARITTKREATATRNLVNKPGTPQALMDQRRARRGAGATVSRPTRWTSPQRPAPSSFAGSPRTAGGSSSARRRSGPFARSRGIRPPDRQLVDRPDAGAACAARSYLKRLLTGTLKPGLTASWPPTSFRDPRQPRHLRVAARMDPAGVPDMDRRCDRRPAARMTTTTNSRRAPQERRIPTQASVSIAEWRRPQGTNTERPPGADQGPAFAIEPAVACVLAQRGSAEVPIHATRPLRADH